MISCLIKENLKLNIIFISDGLIINNKTFNLSKNNLSKKNSHIPNYENCLNMLDVKISKKKYEFF